MRQIFIIYFLTIITTFYSCKTTNEINQIDFPINKNVKLTEHSTSALIGMPGDVLLHNNFIIILDLQTNNFFHLFLKKDFTYKGSFIRRGAGPNEENFIFPYIKKYSDDEFYYQCQDGLKIAKIEYDSTSLNINSHIKIDLPIEALLDIDFWIMNQIIFTSTKQTPFPKDYSVINIKTQEVSQWGQATPLYSKKNNILINSTISQKLSTINFKENRIASVFNILPLIRIYSIEDEKLIHETYSANPEKNINIIKSNNNEINTNNLTNYYHRIKSTNNYIYALYGGFPVSSYFKDDDIPHNFDFSNEIHIWKWDGTPIMKLKLDRHIFAFDVTEDNKSIIATSVVDVEKLFEIKIPW